MPIHSHPKHRQTALLLRALGNTKRLAITALLLRYRELTGIEIANYVRISPVATSKHLHRLMNVGLVASHRIGASVAFQLSPQYETRVRQTLNQLTKRFRENQLTN